MSEPSTEARDAAFQVFAKREMPWLLEKPEDDTERLMRTTALIAFGRGYQAGQQAVGGPEARSATDARAAYRAMLEPRLVRQLCGLREHQVKEAIYLLLDYIDTNADVAAKGCATQ